MGKSMEKILEDIYLVRVPLPGSPLKYTNSYIITGENPLIVDTGFNTKESYTVLNNAIEELGIKRKTFFVTHIHADHIGPVGKYAGESYVIISDEEYKIIEMSSGRDDYWMELNNNLLKNGFPVDDLEYAFEILN